MKKAKKKIKLVQKASTERIGLDRHVTPEQALQFIEEFQLLMNGHEGERKLISLRVPERLLEQFRTKAERQGSRYQTRIIELMRRWIREG